MQKLLNIFTTGLVASIIFLAGCSEDFPTAEEAADVTIPTGIADFDSFSMARDKDSVEGLDIFGIENAVSVYVADRHNHTVPDGTIVNFLTNGGALEQNACSTTKGKCTVTWRSQNPAPSDGIVHVLAYTAGEESFVDLNDNDSFDAGETTTDVSEPFIDTSLDGTRDATEEFVDYNANLTFDNGDGVYTGASCVGDTTVCNRAGLYVWKDVTFVVSGSKGFASYADATISAKAAQTVKLSFFVRDRINNPMPDGTSIAITASEGTLTTSSFTSSGGVSYSTNYEAPAAAPPIVPPSTTNVTFDFTITSPSGETSNPSLDFLIN